MAYYKYDVWTKIHTELNKTMHVPIPDIPTFKVFPSTSRGYSTFTYTSAINKVNLLTFSSSSSSKLLLLLLFFLMQPKSMKDKWHTQYWHWSQEIKIIHIVLEGKYLWFFSDIFNLKASGLDNADIHMQLMRCTTAQCIQNQSPPIGFFVSCIHST